MDRLRKANQHIYDLTFLNVRSRIIKKLLLLANNYSTQETNDFIIPVKITHQQIAEMVGAVRETVSKVLQELQDEGLILIQDKLIHLQDLKLLRSMIASED
jgi:CRP/FNR family transcriptional regulator, cyclic AMP receptor protein